MNFPKIIFKNKYDEEKPRIFEKIRSESNTSTNAVDKFPETIFKIKRLGFVWLSEAKIFSGTDHSLFPEYLLLPDLWLFPVLQDVSFSQLSFGVSFFVLGF